MKKWILIVGLLAFTPSVLALSPGIIWRCQASDQTGNSWDASNLDKQTALNSAFSRCREQSHEPRKCFSAKTMCVQTSGSAPVWRCTAYDKRRTVPFTRVAKGPRPIAVQRAERACLKNSPFPYTCFVPVRQCVLRD